MSADSAIVGRAAISDGRGGFEVDEIEVYGPGAGEVLVRIRASGICHTDYDHLKWTAGIMGHEGAGTVEAVGDGVTRVGVGDSVVLNWAVPCGHCFQCRRGAEHLCESKPTVPTERVRHRGEPIARSFFGLGTMADWSVVREEAVVRLPRGFPPTSACIMGCAVMTGFGSAVNAARVERGSSVVVLGVGGVGLNVIQGAVYAGAQQIIAIDVQPARLAVARELGATDSFRASRDAAELGGVVDAVRNLTQGRGADYAFECTAIPDLAVAPLAFVRNGGTAVAVSGVEEEIKVDMELFEWDKTYINPLYGQCQPTRDFPLLIRLYEQGRLRLDELVSRTYPLGELSGAFEDMLSGKISKGVVLL